VSLQPDDKKKKYHQLKDLNEHLLKQLETGQQELDQLNMKKSELEEVSNAGCLCICLISCYLCNFIIFAVFIITVG